MSGYTDEAALEVHDLIHGAERRASQDNYTLVTSGLLGEDDDDFNDVARPAMATPAKAGPAKAGDDKLSVLNRAMDKTKNILHINKA